MSPRLAKVKAYIAKNRVPLGIAGAAAVVGVAVMRSRGGGGKTKGTSGTVAPTSASSPQGQLASAGGAAYDSTTNDLYNAFQPQIESLRDLMEKLQGQGVATTPTPTPAPAPAPTPDTSISITVPAPSYGGAAGGTADNPVVYAAPSATWEDRGFPSAEMANRADAYARENGLPTGKVWGSGW